ncbi:hypothetical protein AB0G04_30125 [Actinoplanes sp. NPDC023801]|uniref:hypothetical protein n=1 Tax=Actinoplanes sp. NPDC023801 TaxID=3154595 RepID=UPI0033E3CF64
MDDVVLRIRDLVGWDGPEAAPDWPAHIEATGIRFPADFRRLAETFPPGEFQGFFKILHPDMYEDAAEYRAAFRGHAGLLRCRAYPKPGGVIPWGTVQFDYLLCWIPEGDDPDRWPVAVFRPHGHEPEARYEMTAAELVHALLIVPCPIERLAYVAEAEQPPDFGVFEDDEHDEDDGDDEDDGRPAPSPGFWMHPALLGALPEPVDAAAELRPYLTVSPGTADRSADALPLPGDYRRLVAEVGTVTAGPATLLAPPRLAAETERLRARIAGEREAGTGPLGPIFPEENGLILWGVLEGGGYLFWMPYGPDPDEWRVVALDRTLRFSAHYRMSATRFLLALSREPGSVVLPPV